VTHPNAPLTPTGRLRLARTIVEDGRTVRRAAERFQCAPATAAKWSARYRVGEPMTDRSSRPHTSPRQTPRRVERRILALRVTRRWGPHRIGHHLGLPHSTVERVLTRYQVPLLAHLDQVTGLPVRSAKPVRYEHEQPGDLVHVDVKKLGRIPAGGGHRTLGRAVGHRDRRHGVGYAYLHHAVDDHSRLAYSEILADERKETAAGFWTRASAFFASHGITVARVLTDIQAR
jgi:transposase-like protein